MREKNIWERIRNSSNCRVLILNLILTLCLNLLLEFTERRSVGEVITFVQERTFVFLYNGFMFFHCIFSKEKDFCLCIYQWLLGFSSDCERSSFK